MAFILKLILLLQPSFFKGETLNYKIYYLGFPSGSMTLTTTPIRHGLKIEQRVISRGLIGAIYPIDDTLTSWVELPSFRSLIFIKNLKERGEKKLEYVYFLWDKKEAIYKGKAYPLDAPHALDSLASLYWVRLTLKDAPKRFTLHNRKKTYLLEIPKPKKSHLYVKGHRYPVLEVQPLLIQGKLKEEGEMHLWLLQDEDYTPLRMDFALPFGKMRAILKDLPHKGK